MSAFTFCAPTVAPPARAHHDDVFFRTLAERPLGAPNGPAADCAATAAAHGTQVGSLLTAGTAPNAEHARGATAPHCARCKPLQTCSRRSLEALPPGLMEDGDEDCVVEISGDEFPLDDAVLAMAQVPPTPCE